MASARRLPSSKRAITGLLTVAALGLTASPALAHKQVGLHKHHGIQHASLDASQCSAPALTQAYLPFGDNHLYAILPGQTVDNFDGTGWTLSGGASVVSTTLQDGTTGQVLDLPAGASATTPPFCVNSGYPTAKVMVQDVIGAPNVSFYVTYSNGNTPSSGVPSPPHAWSPSPPLKLYPSSTPGWQLATFTFVAGNGNSDVQLYNFQVDPYAKR